MPPIAPSNGHTRFVLDAITSETLVDASERETQAGAPIVNGDNGDRSQLRRRRSKCQCANLFGGGAK